jgi:hypothetical protein
MTTCNEKQVLTVREMIKRFTMKANWLLLLLLLVASNSCKKEERTENRIKSKIIGRWELELYSCGECITQLTIYPQGNGNIIEFAKDGQFVKKSKDSITFNGRYDIITDKECNKSGNVALQTNEAVNGFVRFITIENLKLQLSTPSCYADGATSIYRRVE